MRKRHLINTLMAVAIAANLALALTSCRHSVQSTNPVVIQVASEVNAEKVVNTIAHGLLAADQTIDSVQTEDPGYYAAAQPKLKLLRDLNESANQCLINAFNGGTCDWKTAVVTIAQKAGDPNALTAFGFKNPATQKKVQEGFKLLTAGINLAVQFQKAGGQ